MIVIFITLHPIPIINIISILVCYYHLTILSLAMSKILYYLITIELGHFYHQRIIGLSVAISLLLAFATEAAEVY